MGCWASVLAGQGGHYLSEAIALNGEKGNLGMSDKKLVFKPLLLNSKELLNQGEEPLLIIPLVNQAVILTLAALRTNSHLAGISSDFSLRCLSDCSCCNREIASLIHVSL